MTKQEQIAEMANCNPCYERYGECPIKDKATCTSWTRAVNQYEQGYRKISEEAVVLTKEECEHKVILDEDHFERALNYERENVRKETAKEILNIGKKLYEIAYHKSNAMPRLIEWIKVEYGVEVEE